MCAKEVSESRQALAPSSILPVVCRKDEEVTISYGNWPNDVFLLFFGFVPDNNQHDAVVLFHSLEDLVNCYQALVQQQQQQQREQILSQQHTAQPLQQQQQTALQQQHQQNIQQHQTDGQSSTQQSEAGLQLRQQSDHTGASSRKSNQEHASSLQSSELSSEATAAERDAGQGCTESLAADLQDRLGHGDWSRCATHLTYSAFC